MSALVFSKKFSPLSLLLVIFSLSLGCETTSEAPGSVDSIGEDHHSEQPSQDQEEDQQDQAKEELFLELRRSMIEEQIRARGLQNEEVLAAMQRVPRHQFVPAPLRERAYEDNPLPIGFSQTISQPYIVALMTDLLDLQEGQKVLEIGTGSGYQAAVLAEMGVDVYSIEIICELAERALSDLIAAGYDEVNVKCGDGYKGWTSAAPFDRIIITAAPPEIPQALVEQLTENGLMVVPVGEDEQVLQLVRRDGNSEDVLPVRFVPMVPGDE